MQQENYRLTRSIKVYEEHKSSEVASVKDMYDKQIEELKAALDAMNKQYNQLKVGAEGLLHENEDYKNKLMRKDGDLSSANDRIQRMEDEMRQMANQISLLDAEKNKFQTQLQVRNKRG